MENGYRFNQSKNSIDVNYTNYYWFENGFSPSELISIEQMTSDLEFQKAGIGELNETNRVDSVRKSSVKWCPQNENWEWVYSKLHDMIVEANEQMWGFDLTSMREQIQYTEYYEGGGHYTWHMDCGIGIQNQRKVSVTVQLSGEDEYEGGDLEFNVGKNMVAPRGKGNVVIFPSFYLHRVTPVTKGTRKSFVLWVGGEPYK
jgi:PKHD-type hydroxylase